MSAIVLALAFALLCPSAYAQEGLSGPSTLTFELTPYLWLAGVDGDVTARRTTAKMDSDFTDMLDKLEFGFAGHLDARKGKWAFFLDGMYLKLGDEGKRPLLKTESEIEALLAEFGVAYRVYDHLSLRKTPSALL